jgi:hypothetical protein
MMNHFTVEGAYLSCIGWNKRGHKCPTTLGTCLWSFRPYCILNMPPPSWVLYALGRIPHKIRLNLQFQLKHGPDLT